CMDPVCVSGVLVRMLLLGCLCVLPLQGQKPGQVDPLTLDRADPRCWDSSSAVLLEMHNPHIAESVAAFWDLMVFLKSSDNKQHSTLFWDLAQVFWDIYVDCVLSRSHGLGRRQITHPEDSLFYPYKRLRSVVLKSYLIALLRQQGARENAGGRRALSVSHFR
uniref:Family with sequence similarity 237 member A n=1 Tax=Denticeps clupeoides TaxID=299321 RepID=A0AAY4EYG3_9TELE